MSPAEVVRLYLSGLPSTKVAKLAGVTPAAVRNQVVNAGHRMRASTVPPVRTGHASHSWKGGKHRSNGYVYVWRGPNRRQLEHRYVMEQTLGRALRDDEIVHHMNGIRDDNRADNLTVTTLKDHEHYTYVKSLQRRIRELEALIQKRS